MSDSASVLISRKNLILCEWQRVREGVLKLYMIIERMPILIMMTAIIGFGWIKYNFTSKAELHSHFNIKAFLN